MKYIFSLAIIAFLSLLSCHSNTQKQESKTKEFDDPIFTSKDIPGFELKIYRGAFHYDTLAIIGNQIKFIPDDGAEGTSKLLKDSIVIHLVNQLITDGIFEMDSIYANETSCNSALNVLLSAKNKHISIRCYDYKRGCPKILQDLEDKLVELQGDGLSRVNLPG